MTTAGWWSTVWPLTDQVPLARIGSPDSSVPAFSRVAYGNALSLAK